MRKLVSNILILGVIFLGSVYLLSGWIIGSILERPTENLLTKYFGMPVTIENMYFHPWPGVLRADRLTFWNQPEFEEGPHFDMYDLECRVDALKFFQKEIDISVLKLKNPLFSIDRRMFRPGPRNNVITWFRHIKKFFSKPSGHKWPVAIRRFEIHQGTFAFKNRVDEKNPQIFLFQQLEGALEGFHWPTPDPSALFQSVWIQGVFGNSEPAPVWIAGKSNFATGKVSFDLVGVIADGAVTPDNPFWSDMPVDFSGGRYKMMVHAVSHLKELTADADLTFFSPQVKVRGNPSDVFWGTTLKTVMGFIQSQQEIRLPVQVRGTLSNPEFLVMKALSDAFQKALADKTNAGMRHFRDSAIKFASATQELVVGKPLRAVGGAFPKPPEKGETP